MVFVALDPLGRLTRLEAVPPQVDVDDAAAQPPAWDALFAEAGLDMGDFSAAKPQRLPAGFADARMAWVESNPRRSDRPMRVEAAAYKGRPVSFELLGPWSRPARLQEARRSAGRRASEMIVLGILAAVVVGGLVLARRNIRMGRGDRRGAFRIGLFILISLLLPTALFGRYVPAASQIGLLVMSASWALFYGTMTWLTYLALEPFVRRWWPDTIISWSRLIAGRVSDPLVGRDVLVGVLAGSLSSVVFQFEPMVSGWLQAAPPVPRIPSLADLLGVHRAIADILALPATAILLSILWFFLLFLARLALRRDWLAVLACCLLVGASALLQGGWAQGILVAVALAGYFIVLLRFGLVALASISLTEQMLGSFPLTLDPSVWYMGQSILVLAVLVALVIYAFKIALAGRPAFGVAGLDD